MPDTDFKLEPLCVHHGLKDFSSGNQFFDEVARNLQRRIAERDTDGFVAVAAIAEDGRVAGIASTADLDVDLLLPPEALDVEPSASDTASQGVWLFYQLLAIDRAFQHGNTLKVLLEELIRIGESKLAHHPHYVGELASPVLWRQKRGLGLQSYLRERGFRELVDDPMGWWYKPRVRGYDDSGELAS